MPFDSHATAYSLDNARLLGQAAAISYSQPAACETWARNHGFDEAFDFFSSRGQGLADTQGFVAQSPQAVLVVFRGTEPGQAVDWLSDFAAAHESWDHAEGKVHKGFYQALRAVWGAPQGKEILPKRLVERGSRTVWIAGHSLGGALAELCAAQARFVSGVPVQGVYTFGQPRVGSEKFADLIHAQLGSRIFRHINDKDIVPRVPFFGMGYRHYGVEVFFDHQGQRHDGRPALERLSDALRLARLALNTEPVKHAAKLVREAAKAAGLRGDRAKALHDLVRKLESEAIPDLKQLSSGGVEKIADHNMQTGYLARLGTAL
jgi:triacylglycerol lipase